MIILVESMRLEEILQSAGNYQLNRLKDQMESNPELKQTLTTPLKKLPKYKYLTNIPIIRNAALFDIIEESIKKPSIKPYFIKSSKGLYAGFIAVILETEDGKTIVDDVKMFSFGLSAKEDEDMIRKDAPLLLNQCLKRYPKVRWDAMKDNPANAAYEIYRKKHNGIRNDLGDKWEYVFYNE
jgi:hypothetical protein